MAKTVIVNRDECTGCELCADTLPEVFEMDADGLCRIKDPTGASEDKIQEVIDSCPAECLHWK
ncbi:MAG TPA: ferredoxin [Spirochaetota bacterium]|mgnify:CR=1 FL=1|nr:ferredoxin [Spirochaetota bacterium]HNT11770.1 ferredoxin [Spirochaetota bacterium]HNV47108.1 ferredoxin [Spirochaetota bacterium]HOS40525.1 ferredoxin [Spirochaetota bacterium]HPU88739.1 ferredoxin [Spirochaetota bacterium]